MIVIALYLVILLGKAILAWRYAHAYPTPKASESMPIVNICQPILSGDPDLEHALESNLLALPQAHFIWLIDVGDDEAARVTALLKQRHPNVRITLNISPQPPEGANPKLFKLEAAREFASHGTVVVLDDDTRLPKPSLHALIDALQPAALATGLPFYRDSDNVYGRLLAQFVNNNSAMTYLAPLCFAAPISINGMCYALRADTLAKIGGYAPIMKHLTDDLAMAQQVRNAGGRIAQTPYPQEVATTLDSLPRYIAQMHRWYLFALLLLRRQGLGMKVVIGTLYGMPPILLVVAVFGALLHPSWFLFCTLLAAILLRGVVLCALQRRLSGTIRHRPFLSLLSELIQPLHLLHAVAVKSIRWRSRRYRVFDNDKFVSI